jgi:hypothetical protein
MILNEQQSLEGTLTPAGSETSLSGNLVQKSQAGCSPCQLALLDGLLLLQFMVARVKVI